MKNKLFILPLLVLNLIFGGVTHAEDTIAEKPHVKKPGPCKSDVEKFCKDVQKGDGKIAACLKEHKSDVTNECKISMDRREKRRALHDACGEELKTYCPKKEGEKKPVLGRAIFDCLEKHESKLSATCKAKLNETKPPVETEGGVH